MGRSSDLYWQVLRDEDEWWAEADDAPTGAGPAQEAPRGGRKGGLWLLLSLVMAGLLLAQRVWLSAGQAPPAVTSAAADAPRHVWESDFFVFPYGSQEQDAAAEAARLLDMRYGQVRRGLGLPPIPETEKLALPVIGAGPAHRDAFVCAGLAGLADEMVAQALPQTGTAGAWRVSPGFVLGLRGWARGNLCPAAAAQAERAGLGYGGRMPRLAELSPALYDFPYRAALPGETAREGTAFALLLAYAQERYGPGRLPVLLAALQQPATWAQTIPAVYGVSVQEFEAGWEEWLDRARPQPNPHLDG